MPVWCTNRSLPWSSGVMNPNPFSSLNHFTVPVAMGSSLGGRVLRNAGGAKATTTDAGTASPDKLPGTMDSVYRAGPADANRVAHLTTDGSPREPARADRRDSAPRPARAGRPRFQGQAAGERRAAANRPPAARAWRAAPGGGAPAGARPPPAAPAGGEPSGPPGTRAPPRPPTRDAPRPAFRPARPPRGGRG